jgi:flagellar protein FliS
MNPYSKPTDQYFLQRVLTATPGQLAMILLEGGQRYLRQGIQAMNRKDYREQARCFSRTAEFVVELHQQLNVEEGGPVVENLMKIYDWWLRECMDASAARDARRLEYVAVQMDEMRATWAAVVQTSAKAEPAPAMSFADLA